MLTRESLHRLVNEAFQMYADVFEDGEGRNITHCKHSGFIKVNQS